MDKAEIIEKLKSIVVEHRASLTTEQEEAIIKACPIIKHANTREEWLKAAQQLGPLLIQVCSKFLDP